MRDKIRKDLNYEYRTFMYLLSDNLLNISLKMGSGVVQNFHHLAQLEKNKIQN